MLADGRRLLFRHLSPAENTIARVCEWTKEANRKLNGLDFRFEAPKGDAIAKNIIAMSKTDAMTLKQLAFGGGGLPHKGPAEKAAKRAR